MKELSKFSDWLNEKFYEPSKSIKHELDTLVAALEKQHIGGRPFFDALDASIKTILDRDIIFALLKGNENEWVVSSGEFGDIVYKLWEDGKIKCKGILVFNGKMLTNKIGVRSYYPKDFDISKKTFVYVDDSHFSGSTVKKIGDYLSEHKSSISAVNVIYDGSKEKKKNVNSFFRYYN